jgi:phosphoserine aminotransferase
MFKGMPVVCDMSSDIGSRKVDWNKFGVVYAGAQKNLGAAGVTVVIIREDLIGHQAKDTPFLLNWELFDKSPNGYFNTPATYSIYVTGLNVAHMLRNGGLNHYVELADRRSKILYDFIDNSGGFYSNPVDKKFRSKINVPVRIRPDHHEKTHTYTRLEEKFIKEA